MEITNQSEVRQQIDGNYKQKIPKFSTFQAVNEDSDILNQVCRKIKKVRPNLQLFASKPRLKEVLHTNGQ